MPKKFTILIGKSASGKTTLANYMVKHGYKKYKTTTTRPMRENETKDDYNFVSENKFLNNLDKGKFVEYNTYNVVFDGKQQTWYYGTPIKNMLFDFSKYVIVLTLNGAIEFVNYYGKENCDIVYVDCSDNIRQQRAKARGSYQEDEWFRRMKADELDFDREKVIANCNIIVKSEGKTLKKMLTEVEHGRNAWTDRFNRFR